MKYKYLLFILLFVSCSSPVPWMPEEDFQSIEDIQDHMELYTYVYEETPDFFKAEDVYLTKTGDCDSFCGLVAHLFIYSLGLDDVELVACINPDGIPHVLVYHNGIYYEGENAKPIFLEYEILFHYQYSTYDKIAWLL